MTFLARKYRLGSFKQKQNATWEFVISDEKIDEAAVRAELSSRWRWDRRTPPVASASPIRGIIWDKAKDFTKGRRRNNFTFSRKRSYWQYSVAAR